MLSAPQSTLRNFVSISFCQDRKNFCLQIENDSIIRIKKLHLPIAIGTECFVEQNALFISKPSEMIANKLLFNLEILWRNHSDEAKTHTLSTKSREFIEIKDFMD